MIAPTFEPGGDPGQSIEKGARQATLTQSWMDRAQEREIRDHEFRQKVQEEIDQAPVKALQREADRMGYHAKIANAQILEATRKQAAEQAPEALARFIEITQIPDFDKKAAALDKYAAEVAWMGNIPENKGFIDAVNDARGKAHLDSIANGKIAQMKDAVTQRAQTADAQIEQRAKAAELKAENAVQLKAKDEEIARMKMSSQEKVADTRGKATVDAAKMTAQRPANAAAIKVNEAHLTAGEQAMTGLRDAQRAITLLDDVRTGTAASKQVAAQRLGQLFGVDTSTAEAEELQRILGDAVLKRVNQTKGSISDKEMALFDQYSASLGKSAEGNKAILNAYANVLRREVQIAKMVNQGRTDGLSEREIQLEVNDFILNNPIDLSAPTADTGSTFDDPKKEALYQSLKKKQAERAAAAKK